MYLGIETSGEQTGLALIRDDQVLAAVSEATQAKHNEMIFGLLDTLFAGAGMGLDRVTGIGVSIGPGMFTSLRVGLSVAKGFAMSRGIPLKGISTLDALAETALRRLRQQAEKTLPTLRQEGQAETSPEPQIIPVIDAHKNEVYTALYQGTSRRSEYQVTRPEALAQLCVGDVVLCGSGVRRYQATLESVFGTRAAVLDQDYPAPETIARMAAAQIAAGSADDFAQLSPVYLRRTDAELRREERSRA